VTRKTIKEEFAQAVQNYLLIEQTALIPADFALIFGNKHIIDTLADRTAALYHEGYFPLIVASGGVKTKARITEAEALRRALVSRGVPDDAILTEKKARHTGENVTFTRTLMADKGRGQDMTSVISIGHIIAARRFLMTLERHWPEIHKMQASANPFNTAPQEWHLHETFRRTAMTEWRKIKPSLKQDLIREVNIAALDATTASLRDSRSQAPAAANHPNGPGSDSGPQPA
jgi:hypothetical protein